MHGRISWKSELEKMGFYSLYAWDIAISRTCNLPPGSGQDGSSMLALQIKDFLLVFAGCITSPM